MCDFVPTCREMYNLFLQNVNDDNAVDAIVKALSEKCDSAPKVQGQPSSQKVFLQ